MKSAIIEMAIFSLSLQVQTSIFTHPSGCYQVCLQNLERNHLLGCEIWLPIVCTVSMGDLWHSYVGSTSVLPDYSQMKSDVIHN